MQQNNKIFLLSVYCLNKRTDFMRIDTIYYAESVLVGCKSKWRVTD